MAGFAALIGKVRRRSPRHRGPALPRGKVPRTGLRAKGASERDTFEHCGGRSDRAEENWHR